MRADRTAGFTLVELLVSMAVLSLVALVMISGLRFTVRAVASTDQRREAMEELTLGLSVLRGELERAEPLMIKAGGRDLVLFAGYGDRLRFANVEPPYFAGPPYLAYEYAIRPDGGVYRIDLRRAPIDPNEPDLAVVESTDPRTLLRVPGELRFTYWGSIEPRKPPSWHAEWPVGPRLPDAIRLAGGDAPGWPDLVVPMRITAPWYCGGAGDAQADGDQAGADETTAASAGLAGDGGVGDEGRQTRGATERRSGQGSDGKAGCPGEEPGTATAAATSPATDSESPFDRNDGFGSSRSSSP